MKTKNLTISLDAHLLDEVRQLAQKQRTSPNGLIRNFLEGLVGKGKKAEETDSLLMKALEEIETSSKGKKWTREDAYRE